MAKMSADEIDYNPFYHLLQERYRDKYEMALSNCWTICIPCSTSLRGIDISENFVDAHLLKKTPTKSRSWTSTDKNGSYAFDFGDDNLKITTAPFPNFENYEVKILHTETAYNKEFETYAILVIDKPLSPEFKTKPSDEDLMILEKDITTLDEALQFFCNFLQPQGERWLNSLNTAVENLIPSITPTTPLEKLCGLIHETVATQWNVLLCTHSLKRQRDARFQGLLSSAIEIYIVNRLHDQIFPLLCVALAKEDERIYVRAREFCELGVTVDQLGAPEDFAVPLPAALGTSPGPLQSVPPQMTLYHF